MPPRLRKSRAVSLITTPDSAPLNESAPPMPSPLQGRDIAVSLSHIQIQLPPESPPTSESSPLSSPSVSSPLLLARSDDLPAGCNDDDPWDLIPDSTKWTKKIPNYRVTGTIPGPEGPAFLLKSPTPLKLRRAPVACDGCRKLKTKCSGNHPACDTCVKRHHVCNYSGNPGKKGRAVAGAETRGSQVVGSRSRMSPASSREVSPKDEDGEDTSCTLDLYYPYQDSESSYGSPQETMDSPRGHVYSSVSSSEGSQDMTYGSPGTGYTQPTFQGYMGRSNGPDSSGVQSPLIIHAPRPIRLLEGAAFFSSINDLALANAGSPDPYVYWQQLNNEAGIYNAPPGLHGAFSHSMAALPTNTVPIGHGSYQQINQASSAYYAHPGVPSRATGTQEYSGFTIDPAQLRMPF